MLASACSPKNKEKRERERDTLLRIELFMRISFQGRVVVVVVVAPALFLRSFVSSSLHTTKTSTSARSSPPTRSSYPMTRAKNIK